MACPPKKKQKMRLFKVMLDPVIRLKHLLADCMPAWLLYGTVHYDLNLLAFWGCLMLWFTKEFAREITFLLVEKFFFIWNKNHCMFWNNWFGWFFCIKRKILVCRLSVSTVFLSNLLVLTVPELFLCSQNFLLVKLPFTFWLAIKMESFFLCMTKVPHPLIH